MILTLAKIVAVNGQDSIDKSKYNSHYIPQIDMYLFFTEAAYDTETGSYSGHKGLHNQILIDYKLPQVKLDQVKLGELNLDQVNFLSVDIRSSDRRHTYLTSNRRMYQLNRSQKEFIAQMFDVDYF